MTNLGTVALMRSELKRRLALDKRRKLPAADVVEIIEATAAWMAGVIRQAKIARAALGRLARAASVPLHGDPP